MLTRPFLAAAACFPLALPLGCSSNGDATDDAGTTGPSSTGRSNTPDASARADSSTSSPDSSTTNDDSGSGAHDAAVDAPANGPVPLPFFVSDQFVPSGFMGDSPASMNAITMKHDSASCKSPRPPGAGGDCYSITWAPTPPDGGSAWAGVYWQSPSDNWGTKPGKAIAPGATKVSFYAAGAVGGETIQLCTGGIGSASTAYKDTFSAKSQPIALTTAWTRYEISLQGASYTSVLGAFCWTAAASAPMSAQLYIDDLKWE